MKRSYESGSQKRKRKQQIQQNLQSIPKLDKYKKSSDKMEHEQESIFQDETVVGQTPTSSASLEEQSEVSEACGDLNQEISLEQLSPSICAEIVQSESSSHSSDENEEFIESSTVILSEHERPNDIGQWKSLSEDDKSYWIEKGPSECQHWNDNFKQSKRSDKNHFRYCSKSIFKGTKANGEVYDREWLVYSPTIGSVYCFVCKLFSSSSSALASTAFSDWKHVSLIHSRGNSQEHRDSLLKYLTRKQSCNLDAKLPEQISAKIKYWKQVIQCCVEVIKTLAERGLAFRGQMRYLVLLKMGIILAC